jgi:hypothetical protein
MEEDCSKRMPLRLFQQRDREDKTMGEENYKTVLPSGQPRDSIVPAWLLDQVIAYTTSQGFGLI